MDLCWLVIGKGDIGIWKTGERKYSDMGHFDRTGGNRKGGINKSFIPLIPIYCCGMHLGQRWRRINRLLCFSTHHYSCFTRISLSGSFEGPINTSILYLTSQLISTTATFLLITHHCSQYKPFFFSSNPFYHLSLDYLFCKIQSFLQLWNRSSINSFLHRPSQLLLGGHNLQLQLHLDNLKPLLASTYFHIKSLSMPVNWKDPEAFTRLLAAMVAAQDMKVCPRFQCRVEFLLSTCDNLH